MIIGNIDTSKKVLLIAEIGNNHEGDFDRAKEMIAAAAQSGADAVKFQTIVPDKLVASSQTQRIQQLERFRFSYDQYGQLAEVAKDCGVMFLSTPFDLESVQALEPLVPAFKVASCDNNFTPLLKAIAATGKPPIISTGLATIDEIRTAKSVIEDVWQNKGIDQQMAILHCVSSYPTEPQDANLSAIHTLANSLGCPVGYSDHTLGIQAAVLAVAVGARIIEKHFTLDKNFSDFRDHQLSADPSDLKKLAEGIEEANQLLGDGGVDPRDCESDMIAAIRRSIVAGRDLSAGESLTLSDLSWVRPGGGLAPGSENRIIGRRLINPIAKGEQILIDNLKD